MKKSIPASEKIFWPEGPYSKQDLLDYYDRVCDYILDYLKDRPLILKRYPQGVNSEYFFQRDFSYDLPDFVSTCKIKNKSDKKTLQYIVCNNKETLLYLAHLDTIELHPWSSRVSSLDYPDYIVFDLDPGHKTKFEDLITVSKKINEILSYRNLISACKSSGKRGLHVYSELPRKMNFQEARSFAHEIAQELLEDLSAIASLESSPQKREGKLYIDIMRNVYGQSAVAPYSLRGSRKATVSFPLDWMELDDALHIEDFNIKTVPELLQEKGDAWSEFKASVFCKQ